MISSILKKPEEDGAMRRQSGFTLMEMLVSVAIIAILTAVAIPVFSGSLEGSREAACSANRRSLKGLLSVAWMVEGRSGYDQEITYHLAEYACPSGGTLTPALDGAAGRITVTCSVHGGSSLSMADGVDALKNAFQALCSTTPSYAAGSHRIDSTSPGEKLGSLLETLGMDKAALSACRIDSWCINNSASGVHQIYWTDQDVSKLSSGDPVTVLRYNIGGGYDGLYSVWTTTAESAVYDGGGTNQHAGERYMRLSVSGMTEVKESAALSAADKKDLDPVLDAYRAYLERTENAS